MLPLTDRPEVARGAEAGVEVVLRDAEDVGVVEQLVEEREDLALGEAGDVDLGRLDAALGRSSTRGGGVPRRRCRTWTDAAGRARPGCSANC